MNWSDDTVLMLIARLSAAIFFCALLAFQPPGASSASIGTAYHIASYATEVSSLPADARQSGGAPASEETIRGGPAQGAAEEKETQAGRADSDTTSTIAALRKEADDGDAEAQYELGMAYVVGVGVERDPEAAAEWMERAALQGFPAAVADLGIMYLNGDGVPRDRVMACALLMAAVKRAAPAEIQPEVACDELSVDDRDTARRISVDPTLWHRT